MLHDKLVTKGVKFVGYWPTEGYEFTSDKPVIADGQLFVGLAPMKPTSTILAMNASGHGVSKFLAKWPNTGPEHLLTDGEGL